MNDEAPPLRVAVVGIVCLSLFAALFARLYYLQVLEPTSLEQVRPLPSEQVVRYQAERGRILDRTGTRVLVDSRQAIDVTIDRQAYADVEDKDALLLRLARAFNEAGMPIKVSDIEDRLADPKYDPLKPVPIAHDVSPELEIKLLERAFEFPSVDTRRVWLRVYPNGPVASHLLGYVGAANEEDLAAREDSPKPYQPGDEIGKAGVEYLFEGDLRGVPEERGILVDLRNEPVGTVSVREPETGDDLLLTIDLELQRATERLLAEALASAREQPTEPEDPEPRAPAGAVVVLDVQTGEVLAMASHPSYDPAEFVGGISSYRFSELNDPAAHNPLLNRAVQSVYAPGSTFKPVTAYAALRTGLIDPEERYRDRGYYEIEDCRAEGGAGCEFQNAGRAAYGRVDLHRSLVVSSDTYYYRIGDLFWNNQQLYGPTPIQDAARGFGFGTPTGIQLPGESAGLVTDPASKAVRHAENPEAFPVGDWYTGDNVNLAIGQGDLAVTPLQLANLYATIANGGRVLAPSVAKAVVDHDTGAPTRTFEPRELGRVDLPPDLAERIRAALAEVVSDDEGTAHDAFVGFPLDEFPVAGKTGTAEVLGKADSAIFAAYAPTASPRYAVAAVLEESGFGADVAAPLVRRVLEHLPEVQPLVADEGPSSTTTTPTTATPTAAASSTSTTAGATTTTTTATAATATATAAGPTSPTPGSPASAGPTGPAGPPSAAGQDSASTAPSGPLGAPSNTTRSVDAASAGGEGAGAPGAPGGAGPPPGGAG